MRNEFLDAAVEKFFRKHDPAKVTYLKGLSKVVLPTQVRRIQQNDKNVLKELVLPKWLSWDLLYAWSLTQSPPKKEREACILCSKWKDLGIYFKDHFLCEHCFLEIKGL